jgi:glutathione synthase/RimK-type ligase-like ATP-grasp enzyme
VKTLIVVENVKRWELEIESAEVVPAKAFLVEPRFAEMKRAAVYNMCRSLGYQSVGYYVSLLAAARGHRPLPSVATSQALQQVPLVRAASEELDQEIQRSLSRLRGNDFTLSIYFGRNLAKRYDRLARALFNQFPAPVLIARFQRVGKEWRLSRLRLGAGLDIPDPHRDFVAECAETYFARRNKPTQKKEFRYDLAILWSEEDIHSPSDPKAIKRFVRAAAKQGIHAEVIGAEDYGRIGEYDALFIRETTAVDHHTYRFATRAAAEGLVVIDDPEAIIRSGNKVYQAELFARHGIPSPKTYVAHDTSTSELVLRVGMPCVLKKPDGAFSIGVVKVSNEDEARERLGELLKESELVVAQEFVPSEFDWRVGVLNRQFFFLCRYHMARGHWQIVSRKGRTDRYGKVDAAAREDAPEGLIETAVRAASLFGDGLFGVDVKAVDGRLMVMEVNDNPNIDAGFEDALLKGALYRELALWFRTRLDRRGSGGGS